MCANIVLNVKTKTKNNFCTQHVVNLYFSWNSMNNLSSYYGLTDSRMIASDIDLPVQVSWCHFTYNFPTISMWLQIFVISMENLRHNKDILKLTDLLYICSNEEWIAYLILVKLNSVYAVCNAYCLAKDYLLKRVLDDNNGVQFD